MGGCYSRYDCAPQRVERVPAWRASLNEAIKGERSKLVEAYKGFFNEGNKSGFIAQLAKASGIDSIEKIPKEFPDLEYEVKFDIEVSGKGEEPSIEHLLGEFDFPAIKNARFLLDPVCSVATGVNRFYGTDEEERLVIITKGGGVYLKEKSESIPIQSEIPYKDIVIKRKESRYQVDVNQLTDKIAKISLEQGVSYKGRIRKEKGDSFIIDTKDGRIYSFTITRAHLIRAGEDQESGTQRQLEIEYAGYVPGFKGHKDNSEDNLISGMIDLARYTWNMYQTVPLDTGLRMNLSLTNERKYDFVSGRKIKSLDSRLLPGMV